MPHSHLPHPLLMVALAILLMLAVWHDIAARRIPNKLIVCGTMIALSLQAIVPFLPGAPSDPSVAHSVLRSVAGFSFGLLLLLPFYAMRSLGAGDVKLMAVVGAFLGPLPVLGATLLTMMAGGVLAVLVAWRSGQLLQVVVNIQQMIALPRGARTDGELASGDGPVLATGKLPYAIAIACGTAAQLGLADAPGWQFFT